MLQFTLENLIDVNIAAAADGTVVYLVNGIPVPREDFTAIMSALQIMLIVEGGSSEDEDEDEGVDVTTAPFGG